jgi:sigma-B regulation protein RsbU (phosphoserine phosphatase)
MLLRTRVTLIVSISYLVLVAGLTFAGLRSEELAEARYGEATLNGQEIFWSKLIENTLQRLEAAQIAILARPDIAEAAERRNHARLREAVAPLAGDLAHHGVTRWEVVSRQGELLYASQGSLLDPPLVDAGTLKAVVDGGKARGDIVQSSEHGFIAAVSLPLAAVGQVTAAVTLAAGLEPPLAEFKQATGSDIFLVDRTGRLQLGTDSALWKIFEGRIAVRKSRMDTFEDHGRSYAVVVLPLHLADQRAIGALVTVRDFTESQARQNRIRRIALTAVGGFLALVLLGFYVYLRRSFAPLDEAIQVLNALSAGDTSVRLEVTNDRDEIGRIAGAVGVFRDKAVKLEMLEQRRERQRRRQELFIRLRMQNLSEMLDAEARAAVLADLAEIEALAQDGAKATDRGAIEVLAKAFQTMSDRIRDQHESLQALIAERTRDVEVLREALRTRDQLAALRQELDFARELQLSSLPSVFPPFPDRGEFDLHAAMVPAKEVGGDFYDFFLVDHHHLALVIGDASGKGVPAAMFIAITRSLIKAVAPLSASPAECLAFVNTMLSVDNPQLLFATAFYGLLDTRTGEVAFCNAGHPPPLILRADGSIDMIRDVSGVALGVMEDIDYDLGHFRLAEGDIVLLYTDGVTEATDAAQALFAESRLAARLEGVRDLDAAAVIGDVQAAIDGFVGAAPQFDDITMLACRFVRAAADAGAAAEPRRLMLTGFKGEEPEAPPPPAPAIPTLTVSLTPVRRPVAPRLDVTIANDLAELQRLAQAVEDFVARHGLPDKVAFNLNLCLDELITNIVSYGYEDGGRHDITVGLRIENGALVTEIADDGREYDPFTQAPIPDLEAGIEERMIGGLGVFLVKEFMDRTSWRRDNGRNVVTLIKTIGREG